MTYQMELLNELVVDNFAGGGGASTGIEAALKRPIDIAINHNPTALAMHEMNHPYTQHYIEDVWDVCPVEVTKGKPVGLAWFSPDCKHFSKAKGGKPVEKKIRGLAWVAVKWAAKVKPRVIMIENVEEFVHWGPVNKDGKPCKERRGKTFRSFINAFKHLGYKVEWKELRACDYGAPTIRKRLFIVARCDDKEIVWPKPTHGEGLKPYKTAADCIDWSIPCPSIFNRKRPLAESTMKRIAKGIQRYVIDAEEPFIVANGEGLAPFISEHANASSQRNMKAEEPLRTICASVKGGHFSLVTSSLVKFRGNEYGEAINKPMSTITSSGSHHAEVRSFLIKYYGNEKDTHSVNQPLGTVTTKDRFGLVTIKGERYKIVDIGLRMLQPHELFLANGFPKDYIIDFIKCGKKLTKKDKVFMCGNAVSPDVAEALTESNMN